jgi:hypothetical protein
MPADAFAAINDFTRQRIGPDIHYSAGFQLTTAPPADYPYVLIQIRPVPTAGLSFEDLERTLSKELPGATKHMEGKLSDVAANVGIGETVFDRKASRFVMRVRMDVANIGPVSGISFGMVGKDGIVLLHCYAREIEFATHLATFNTLAGSFHFDPGYEFPAGPGGGFLSKVFSGFTGMAILGGIAGAVIGGVYALIRQLTKPTRKQRPIRRLKRRDDTER